MAERGSRVAGSDGGGPEATRRTWAAEPPARPRRMVALRPTSGPAPAAPARAATRGDDGSRPAVGAGSASALAESVFPFGPELPFEPDAEAAAFLNAPRRPLDFYVAPFGTPPFGNPPTSGPRSVFGGPLDHDSSTRSSRLERPQWGPAYPAGA